MKNEGRDRTEGMMRVKQDESHGPYWPKAFLFLFSLNVAWITMWWAQLSKGKSFMWFYSSRIGVQLYHFVLPLASEAVLGQVLFSVILGCALFVPILVLSRVRTVQVLLGYVGGAVALGGFPLLFLLFPWQFFMGRYADSAPFAMWLSLELAVAGACSMLYWTRKWPLPNWASVSLVLLHFVLWSLVAHTYFDIVEPLRYFHVWNIGLWISIASRFGFPVIGFLCTLAWTSYVKQVRVAANQPCGGHEPTPVL